MNRNISGNMQSEVNFVTCPIYKKTIIPVLNDVAIDVNRLTRVFLVMYFINENDVIAKTIR